MKLKCSNCKTTVSKEIPDFCITQQYIKILCPECDEILFNDKKNIVKSSNNMNYFIGTICEAENFIHNISEDSDVEVDINIEDIKIILNKKSRFQKIIDNIIDTEASAGYWRYDLENAPINEDVLGIFESGNNKLFTYICKRKQKSNFITNDWNPKPPIAYAILNTKGIITNGLVN